MDADVAREVLATQHRAVLATVGLDGTPRMTPVLAGVDDAGRVIVSTRQTAYKVHNVRRNPRVYLCVIPDTFFGRWIQIDGTAEIVDLPEAMELLVDYYRRVSGEHTDWMTIGRRWSARNACSSASKSAGSGRTGEGNLIKVCSAAGG